jgi:hypothetical protein
MGILSEWIEVKFINISQFTFYTDKFGLRRICTRFSKLVYYGYA